MNQSSYADRFLEANLAAVDPDIEEIIALETERQTRQIILIPSESIAPLAVRRALGSVFNSIYAEGYPPTRMTHDDEALLLDFDHQLAHYRRYADRRFYKGTTYVHFIETLAQRRCAQLFVTPQVSADQIFVNVQPLSGAAANLAVYDALLQPGDTLMGMDLFEGGHLSHGSPFHLSGKRYRIVSYCVDHVTERLDYDSIMAQAREHRPRMIVAGFTSYPWAPDWLRLREIADEVGAFLMADISHPAGLVTAGEYPNPVGLADVTVFTTHKTLCGPRGAVVLTTDPDKARLVDAAVFPGAQGGPHPNKFAAMAVAFKIAATPEFKELQRQIVTNAQALVEALQKRDLPVAYGGTDTHMLLVDLRHMNSPEGYPLLGEIVVRVLELCGIVANKNTLPGDTVTSQARGVRIGTPWVTQRGMGPDEMDRIADSIHCIVTAIQPFTYEGLTDALPRGKLALEVLESVKRDVAHFVSQWGADTLPTLSGYPHYFAMPAQEEPGSGRRVLVISGWRGLPFVQQVTTGDFSGLPAGQHRRSLLLGREGEVLDDVFVQPLEPDIRGRDRFLMAVHNCQAERVKAWLRGLGDGYLLFDPDDLFAKIEGPAVITDLSSDSLGNDSGETGAAAERLLSAMRDEDSPLAEPADESVSGADLYRMGHHSLFALQKPYFVGQKSLHAVKAATQKREWSWQPQESSLKRTCLYQEHAALTRHLVPFAGWEMPVWYTSVSDEHRATRTAAALFDVSHMGILGVSGPYATSFLNTVTTNYAGWLDDGESQYSHLLDPGGNIIDDIMVYRRRRDDYLMVVNAANADKVWDWLNAVNQDEVVIDHDSPAKSVEGPAALKDLKDPTSGEEQKVDIALQGPQSRTILLRLADDRETDIGLRWLQRTDLMDGRLAGTNVVIAHTGYTGEDVGYEIFMHPDEAPHLWKTILEAGSDLGVKPAGLGARDSTRTEAGLPLYGHELAGPYHISPAECGFASYVKLHKPFFVGREATIERMNTSRMSVIRFRLDEKGVRLARTGDLVVNRRGRVIGWVTSCAIGQDGYLIGMAYVEKARAEVGARIGVFNASRKTKSEKGSSQLGDEVMLHQWATVLSRFAMRE